MKKSMIAIAALSVILFGCEEWQPVMTLRNEAPPAFEPVTAGQMSERGRIVSIAELSGRYDKPGSPVKITEPLVICGKVSSDDREGNIYKSFFIQDETGGIEVKVGKNALYNDYKPGQTVYVDCQGLILGGYGYKTGSYGGNGMIQLGLDDPTGEYESSYIELPKVIDDHIFRGETGNPVAPVELTESQLPGKNATPATCKYLGMLVTLKGLKYDNQIFALLYIDSNKNKKESSNRIFLADKAWGVNTWAMSKRKMTEYLVSGIWDSCKVGNAGDYNYGSVGDMKGDGSYPAIEKAAASVSQYFKMGDKSVQIRTSGYSKFADIEIDPAVLAGEKTVDVTGILSLYQGSIQFTLLSLDGIGIN